ncbi:MAG: type IV pilus assembly protein PilM [Planctomycetota bacterium]|nr:type IV pilus assembly protein PilM [Planctomycetota bacterium]
MALKKGAWGIEIGSAGIRALRLERIGDEVAVTDFTVIHHPKILTSPDLDANSMIRHGLVQFVQAYEQQLKSDVVVVSVPGNQALSRFVSLPPVDPKKIPEMLRYEAAQQIPFPIDEVEWDSQVFQGDSSVEARVGIFAITKERLAERLDIYAECGLNPQIITLSPVAFYNAFSYDLQMGASKAPLALIDVGSSSTDFIVSQGGQCYIRTFPIGGHQFTEAIADGFKIPYSRAERLKLEGATGKYARQVMAAMKGTYEQFIDELRRSLDHYKSTHPDADIRSVVGVGGTLRTTGLRKFVGAQVGIDIVRWDEFKRIRVEGKQAADFAANTVNLATAYGLALQGVGISTIDINLLPTQIARAGVWRKKSKYFAAAAALGVVIGGAMFIAPFVEASALGSGATPEQVAATEQKAKNFAGQYTDLQQRSQTGAVATNMSALTEGREVWAWIVNDAYDALSASKPSAIELGSDAKAIIDIPAENRRLISLEQLGGVYSIDTATGTRQIRVTMQVTIGPKDYQQFLNEKDGVLDWLRSHAKRDTAPYDIVLDETQLVGAFTPVRGTGLIDSSGQSSGFAANSGSPDGAPAGFGAGAGLSGPGAGPSDGGNQGMGGGSFQGKRKSDSGSVKTGGAGTLSGSNGAGAITSGGGGGAMNGRRPTNGAGGSDGSGAANSTSKETATLDGLAPIQDAPNLFDPTASPLRGTIVFTVQLKGAKVVPAIADEGSES